jgi:hypothetical protein
LAGSFPGFWSIRQLSTESEDVEREHTCSFD